MPWNNTKPMNERIKFIAAYCEEEESFTELCEQFGISRKTGYKWVERYNECGISGLVERSRAPLTHPDKVSSDVISKIISAREKHPTWGPRKLLVILERHYPSLNLPVASTIGEIIKRNGLIKMKRKRIRNSPYSNPLGGYERANSIWCADFKGNFPVGGERCHPLTISDGYSRFLIKCQAMLRPLSNPSQKIFEAAFKEYGLPDSIRTDNGAPFSTLAPGGLSRLSIWWIKLGIRPERIMPGRPDQNGRHERMHRTLKAETARPPKSSFRTQQAAFDKFKEEYNNVRPHESLNQSVPAAFYKPSSKQLPSKVPEVEYPSHFIVQKAYPNGVISFLQTQWYMSGCLKNELIGLEEVGDGRFKAYFGQVALGILDAHLAKERKDRQFGQLIRLDGQNSSDTRRRRYKK